MDSLKSLGQRSPFKRTQTSDHIKTDSKAYGVESEAVEVDLPRYPAEDVERRASVASYNISGIHDDTHRKLKPRHIQLIGIGGTIGTALYVQIGRGLLNGGPGSLFLAFTFWCSVVLSVTMCLAEMVTYLPISSPFIRFAGRYVDEAFGFAAGWNFFVFEAILVPFEITACNVIIGYWSTAVPVSAIIAIIIVLYGLINLVNVKWYGEVEFWAALGKVLLIIGLIIFTFVVMLGGNPLGDRFGFRYWNNPGAFKAWGGYEGGLGKWLGFLQCLIQASFVIAGPDYVSMSAGEAENPRVVMPKAFNAVFYRLTTFFCLGALCVGILVPYDDPELTGAFENGLPGAAASPYVVAMNRLRIGVLPHIVNALVLASAFSAGNSYMYCASRSLFGLALEGKAPKIFTRTNRIGVPYNCVIAVLLICLLAFLSVSSGSAKVLGWFVSLITASQLLNFAVMCFTYLCWFKALKAQGISRDSLPYKSFFMPYVAYYGLAWTFTMMFVGGYTVFLPGRWDVETFVFSYFMIGLVPCLFVGWKIAKKTTWKKSHEVDLQGEAKEIDEYTRNFVPTPYKNVGDKIFNKMFGG
ncbi:general amino acid permease Agp2 like protein [Zymoseptoria brevis]|uniref:General amino acid permease Agp2 like protein n=1 Tax=Zymoseptoria brevis TaxID=1047168 RepID=A0A0F4GIH0_9PEZI|nr:general amino acid permease Agp2 like protein [Zymoseptoria brevis]